MSETPIQLFYRSTNILVTGGTGFLGKVLIEKLLRSCPGVENIYLIIRCKKGKSEQDRLKDVLDDVVFQRLSGEALSKIKLIPGDCSLPGLGLLESDRKLLTRKVNVIFHGAATVRFEENLKDAVAINVAGTKEMILLAKETTSLKAFVHISTAYSNCNQQVIGEKFYKPPVSTERILEMAKSLTKNEMEILTPELLESWPNTYVLTKAMAEHFVKQEEGSLPACVFRPAIVTSTYKEPMSGWVDNIYGPIGLTVGAGCGIIRVIHVDSNNEANMVPVDLTANAILAAARETSLNFREEKSDIKIYNYVSVNDNFIKWGDYMKILCEVGLDFPSINSVWYYSLMLIKYRLVYLILAFFLHTLPAYIIDGIGFIIGKNPQMIKSYQKVSKCATVLGFFSVHRFTFINNNVRNLVEVSDKRDRDLFNLDIKTIDWKEYLKTYIIGTRLYILKESLDNLPQARAKWRRLYWLHQLVKWFFICVSLRFFYAIVVQFW